MFIVIIIGVLATIPISVLIGMKGKAHKSTIKSELSSAHKPSVAYHNDNPDEVVTLEILKNCGYNQGEGVTLNIEDGTLDNLYLCS